MLYGNYCYIFIENFPQKFSSCSFHFRTDFSTHLRMEKSVNIPWPEKLKWPRASRVSAKNSKSDYYMKALTDTDSCTVGAWLRRSPKSSITARSQCLDRWPHSRHWFVATGEREAIFTFSSHTEYVKRESIVVAWVKKKKILSFWQMSMIFMS